MPVDDPVDRLLSLRLHSRDGRRSPHKPLLALVALGRLLATGSSRLPWEEAEPVLAGLLEEFGTTSTTSAAQRAAYPFTHLRSDGVCALSADVPMDAIGPLRRGRVVGSFAPDVEAELLAAPSRALATARALVTSHVPDTLLVDVLTAAGLDPERVLSGDGAAIAPDRRRSGGWRTAVVQAWDRQCAFCGYDGQVGGATVGLDAAHVRWFAYGGPDVPENGARAVLPAPQALRQGRAGPGRCPPRPGQRRLQREDRVRAAGLRAGRPAAPPATGDGAPGSGAHRLARTGGLPRHCPVRLTPSSLEHPYDTPARHVRTGV